MKLNVYDSYIHNSYESAIMAQWKISILFANFILFKFYAIDLISLKRNFCFEATKSTIILVNCGEFIHKSFSFCEM